MFLKSIIVIAVIGVTLAEEHAYSSQSIIRYDDHNEQHIPIVSKAIPVVTKIAVPVVTKVALPVHHYVSQGSSQSNLGLSQQSSGLGLSSYHSSSSSSGLGISSGIGSSGISSSGLGLSAYKTSDIGSSGSSISTLQSSGFGVSSGISGSSSGTGLSYSGHSVSSSGLGHSSGLESHGHHAISSQHIQRHDVPAHPPADFYEHHGPAKYEFEYKVQDPHTNDNKYQHESRDGDVVKGVYSLHEADGSIRTVEYFGDKHTGFNANVKHTTKHVEESKHY